MCMYSQWTQFKLQWNVETSRYGIQYTVDTAYKDKELIFFTLKLHKEKKLGVKGYT